MWKLILLKANVKGNISCITNIRRFFYFVFILIEFLYQYSEKRSFSINRSNEKKLS